MRILRTAERAIATGERVLSLDHDTAANRAYYYMFYCATALLNERSLYFRSHRAIHSAFAQNSTRDGPLGHELHRWLIDAFDLRIRADYGFDEEISRAAAGHVLEQAREFLEQTRRYLEREAP